MTAIADEATTDEGEEVMMDALEEFVPKVREESHVDKGVALVGREDDISGELREEDISMIQILSIDSFLSDIYEL